MIPRLSVTSPTRARPVGLRGEFSWRLDLIPAVLNPHPGRIGSAESHPVEDGVEPAEPL